MGKKTKTGERIESLRRTRKMSQTDLADYLSASQPAVSAWEADERQPPTDVFVKLGNLADYPDCMWFWQQAGMKEQPMLSAADRILGDRRAPPSESEIFRVPIVRRGGKGIEERGEFFPVAASLVEHEASTVCLLVDDNSASPSVPSGDLIVLDTSQCEANDLGPFLGHAALMDLGPPEEAVLYGPGYHGLCMGELRRRVLPDDLGGQLDFPFYRAVAALLPYGRPGSRLEGGIMELVIGRAYSPPRFPTTPEEEAAFRAEARRQIIPRPPALKILGRVIGWFRPLPRSGK